MINKEKLSFIPLAYIVGLCRMRYTRILLPIIPQALNIMEVNNNQLVLLAYNDTMKSFLCRRYYVGKLLLLAVVLS